MAKTLTGPTISEEAVLSPPTSSRVKSQSTELAFTAVVGRLDVAILEEEHEPLPLAVQVAESQPERRLRRYELAMLVEDYSASHRFSSPRC